MVTRSLVPAFIALLWVGSARADLQFTPQVSEYQFEGLKFKRLVFPNGSGKEVTYSPPTGWEYSGSAAKLTLRPRDKTQAEATVTKVPLTQPGTLDEKSIKKLTDEALAAVPNGSTEVVLLPQEKNPATINPKETLLITLGYTFYGERYTRSILFLNRASDQIRFQFVSRQADFKDLQRAFQASLFSWQNL